MRGRTLRWLAFIGLMLLFGVNTWQAFSHYDLPWYVKVIVLVAFGLVAVLMLIDLFRPSRTALIRKSAPSDGAGR